MGKTSDLTVGKPGRLILNFFFPLLISNTLQQLYSFADTAIVGKGLGDNSLAAVGNMSCLTFLIFGFSMGLSNGFAIIIAQSFGEKEYGKLRKSLAVSIRLSVIITILLTLFSMIFLRPILLLLQTSPIIMEESLGYGYILFGGLFSTIAYNMCSGVLRSLGDSRTPLKAIIISTVMNIVLNCLFIFQCGWGVYGVAAATIIAQMFSAAFCFARLRKIDFLKLTREDFAHDVRMSALLLKNGLPMALMNSITAIGVMVVQYFVNGLGVAFTSAYSVCTRYLNLSMMPAATAGYAMAAYTGQNYGAKRFDRILDGLKVCLGLALITYALFGSAMFFAPAFLASLILNGKEQIGYVVQFLPICGAAMIFVDMLFVIRNAVQGMGFPFFPMISGIAEMVLRILAIMGLVGFVGFRATAVAEVSAWFGALLINGIAFIMIFLRESKQSSNTLTSEQKSMQRTHSVI